MALVKFGPMVAEVSGKIGGSVYARNRGGAYVRDWTKPLVSTSSYALAAKARLAAYAQAWQGLTDAQRASWKAWAQSNPITNRLGEPRVLSGSQAYVQINGVLGAIGSSTISVPPTGTAPLALATLVADADIGAGDFDLTYTATPTAADDKLYIQACVVASAGIRYVTNLYRLIGVSAAAQASPFDVQSLFEARFGTPNVGDTVHFAVSVVDSVTGLLSQPIRDSVVVTTT